jgi:hypothetical protein
MAYLIWRHVEDWLLPGREEPNAVRFVVIQALAASYDRAVIRSKRPVGAPNEIFDLDHKSSSNHNPRSTMPGSP